ncbi:MAG: cell wall hydrolase [Lachnospiraceae bacterium]|nr:cell wall hydrolase [Lachnospiraceae bacterium]
MMAFTAYGNATVKSESRNDFRVKVQVGSLDLTGAYEDGNQVIESYFYQQEVITEAKATNTVFLSQEEMTKKAAENAMAVAQAEFNAADTFTSESSNVQSVGTELQGSNNTLNAAVKKAVEEKATADKAAAEKAAAEKKSNNKKLTATYKSSITGISDEDYNNLLRIVEAEAQNQGDIGKILVANVILNRVESSRFPNDITDVIFQKGQFSPVSNGRFYSITVSESTRDAVDRALAGEDYSEGALFFANYKYTGGWFKSLDFLFQHKDHCFFK